MTQNQTQTGFDIANYVDYRDKGLVKAYRIGDSSRYGLTAKRFHPETGAPLDSVEIELSIQELNAQRVRLFQTIAQFDELLSDLEHL